MCLQAAALGRGRGNKQEPYRVPRTSVPLLLLFCFESEKEKRKRNKDQLRTK